VIATRDENQPASEYLHCGWAHFPNAPFIPKHPHDFYEQPLAILLMAILVRDVNQNMALSLRSVWLMVGKKHVIFTAVKFEKLHSLSNASPS
jgi:hypothetical protein